jgi:hypothetical protein
MNYKRSEYFVEFYSVFKACLNKDYEKLSDLNMDLIGTICELLGIKTQIILSSELNVKDTGTKRIVSICKLLGADRYLSGTGGSKYQDEKMFEDNSIELMYSDFHEKPYKQLWGDFTGNLSVIDYIFNCGYSIENAWDQ